MAAQPLIIKGYTNPYETYTINSIGTLNILEILKFNNLIKSIVCVTSDKCYKSNNSVRGFVEEDIFWEGKILIVVLKLVLEIITNTYYQSFEK